MGNKVRTYNQLSSKITEELAWRRKELKIVKDQIPNTSSPLQHAALRFAVPILYAHWEGFAKISCDTYLKFVASKYLNHEALQPQFIALSLANKIGKLEVKNIKERTESIELLIDLMTKKSNIKTKNVIQTKSNLRFDVFKEILYILNLNENLFKRYETLIDDLVKTRNTIAHGNTLKVDYLTYQTMHGDVQIVMETLKNEIENSAVQELYKK